MDDSWKLQDAKARFSELIDKALTEGPQVVTRHGKEEAVVISVATFRDLERRARPSLKELLLAPEPRTDDLVPPRRKHKWRKIPDLD